MDPQVFLRLYSLRTVELTFTSFNQQLCIHSHSEVITMLPFSQVPRSLYLMLPSLELHGGDQSPLLPTGVGPHWGLAPGPYLILWPFLVSWSVPPMSPVGAQLSRESEHQSKREPVIPSSSAPPRSSQGFSTPTWLSHQSSFSRGWHCWSLAGASRNVAETSTSETKHHTWRAGELRFITLVGPEELTLQALSTKQRGYRVFYTWTEMIKRVCRGWAIAKSRTRVSAISSSS